MAPPFTHKKDIRLQKVLLSGWSWSN